MGCSTSSQIEFSDLYAGYPSSERFNHQRELNRSKYLNALATQQALKLRRIHLLDSLIRHHHIEADTINLIELNPYLTLNPLSPFDVWTRSPWYLRSIHPLPTSWWWRARFRPQWTWYYSSWENYSAMPLSPIWSRDPWNLPPLGFHFNHRGTLCPTLSWICSPFDLSYGSDWGWNPYPFLAFDLWNLTPWRWNPWSFWNMHFVPRIVRRTARRTAPIQNIHFDFKPYTPNSDSHFELKPQNQYDHVRNYREGRHYKPKNTNTAPRPAQYKTPTRRRRY